MSRYEVYLSSKMRGLPDYGYPGFNEAAWKLRSKGYKVLNPAESFDGDQSLPVATYMRADIGMVLACDMVAVFGNWLDSEGSRLEVAVAQAIGTPVFHLDSLLDETQEPTPVEGIKALWLGIPPPSDPTTTPGPEPITTWAEAEDGLLTTADKIVNGDRQRTYGHPAVHHTRTASLWSAYLGSEVRPQDVSILMILDKASRMRGKNKPDNAVDIAGYAAVHGKVMAELERQGGEATES